MREQLVHSLAALGHEICGTLLNTQQAIKEINNLNPDVTILNINIKEHLDGLELAQKINTPFIFLTDIKDEKVLGRAIRLIPSAILSKPLDIIQLKLSLNLALKRNELINEVDDPIAEEPTTENISNELIIKTGHLNNIINIDEIKYIEKNEKYCDIMLIDNGKISTRTTFKKIISENPLPSFVRVHRSFYVNAKHINSYNATSVNLDQKSIPISRSYLKEFRNFMAQYRLL